MNNTPPTRLLLTLASLAMIPTVRQLGPAQAGTASCIVKATAHDETLPIGIETIRYLLGSPAVAGKAAQEILGHTSMETPRPFQIIATQLTAPTSPASESKPQASQIRPPEDSTVSPTHEQTIFFELRVDLNPLSPQGPPALSPDKLMQAVIDNLRAVLDSAYAQHYGKLESDLESARNSHAKAGAELADLLRRPPLPDSATETAIDPAQAALNTQLNQIIDLSMLKPQMSFAEALSHIKNAVEPPLKIAVLWRDLLDNADIQSATAINFDGLSSVRLSTALDNLLKAISGGFGEDIGYLAKDGVITIATSLSLPTTLETRIYDVPVPPESDKTARELAEVIMNTIEPDSWYELNGDMGQGEIKPIFDNRIAVLQTDKIHEKIRRFLRSLKTHPAQASFAIPPEVPAETLFARVQDMKQQKSQMEVERAALLARAHAIDRAIAEPADRSADKSQDDCIAAELQSMLETAQKLLGSAQQQYEAGRISLAELQQAQEKLSQAKIELAKRKEQLTVGNQLAELKAKRTALDIDLAEKTARIDMLTDQIKDTDRQLEAATAIDPQLSEIRISHQVFKAAEHKMKELATRLMYLTPPTVTILPTY